MVDSWLWIDLKTLLYCCKTLSNTRLKHRHGAVFVPLWANTNLANSFLMSKFSVHKQSTEPFEMHTSMSASLPTFGRRSSYGFFGLITLFGRQLPCSYLQAFPKWNLAQLWHWLDQYLSNESIVSHNDVQFFSMFTNSLSAVTL